MTKEEARELAVQALHQTANVFSDPKLSAALKDPAADVALEDLGIDSLDKVEWCMALEERSGFKIDPNVIERCARLSEVVDVLTARSAAIAE